MLHLAAAAPPGVDEARRALRDELLDPTYWRSWRGLAQLWLVELLEAPGAGDGLGAVLLPVLVALAVAAVAVLVLVLVRRRRQTTSSSEGHVVFGAGEALTATEYRTRAQAHQREGRFDEAVVDAFRAVTAQAVDRRIVDGSPALTAHEVGLALGAAHPDLSARIRAADRTFARVLYGGERASAAQAAEMLDLDRTLDALPPKTGTASDASALSGIEVPR